MEIKLIDKSNFTRDSLKGFRRYQEVKNVYRLKDGNMTSPRIGMLHASCKKLRRFSRGNM